MKLQKQQKFIRSLLVLMSLLICMMSNSILAADSSSAKLKAVKFDSLPDNKLRVSLHFNKVISKIPKSFSTSKPERIIFDFNKAVSGLSAKDMNKIVELGVLSKFMVLDSDNRLRIILDVNQVVTYQTRLADNRVDILLSGGVVKNKHQSYERFIKPVKRHKHNIRNVKFKAMPNKGGKVIIGLSDDGVAVDIQQEGNALFITFPNSYLPNRLLERLDVRDFGTPVRMIDVTRRHGMARFVIRMKKHKEHFSYQVNKQFVVEVLPLLGDEQVNVNGKKKGYSGKRVSMHFQDIKVRAALQLLADTSKKNIVISDSVQGNITLRLSRVPWDQALDIILKTRGLAKREFGTVIIVAPTREIASQEKQELLSQQDVEKLAPISSELLQVNYARAGEIAVLLKDKNNTLLSLRGNVSVDERTNTLWIQDTAASLAEVRALVKKLDIPVKQVLIEARVVTVTRDFERELGVRFGVTRPRHLSGTLHGANALAAGATPSTVPVSSRLNVDLPADIVDANVGSIGIALAKLSNGTLLDLELSALESEGNGEIISSPRIITANQQEAIIEAGEEIPYQEATSSGATSIAFKKAVLSLRVKPQITPDNKLILDLTVNQDSVGSQTFNGVPAIETKEIQTHVLVDNGETIVLGGIYKQTRNNDVKRIPFLGRLPIIGALFRNTNIENDKEELLIFVTPKIVRRRLSGYHKA